MPTGLTRGAGWEIGVSRTLPFSPEELWRLVTSPEGLALWLGPGAHPLTGPIYVTGAEPGDSLEVRIGQIEFLHPYGVIGVGELPKKFRHVDDEDEQLAASLRDELDERAVLTSSSPSVLSPAMLPAEGLDLKDYLGNLEQGLIQQALDDAGGIVARAAERLRIRRTTLVEKMRKYGMSRREDEAGEACRGGCDVGDAQRGVDVDLPVHQTPSTMALSRIATSSVMVRPSRTTSTLPTVS